MSSDCQWSQSLTTDRTSPLQVYLTALCSWYEAVQSWFIVSWTGSESSLKLQCGSKWFHHSSSSVFGSDCESSQLYSLTNQTRNKAVGDIWFHPAATQSDRNHSDGWSLAAFSFLRSVCRSCECKGAPTAYEQCTVWSVEVQKCVCTVLWLGEEQPACNRVQ